MEENHYDVEAEFPEKVKEVDEMMEKLTQNNRLQYIRILNDVVKRRSDSSQFFKAKLGYQFKKLENIDRKYGETPHSQG